MKSNQLKVKQKHESQKVLTTKGFALPPPEGPSAGDTKAPEKLEPTVKELLLTAAKTAELWHDAQRVAYATIKESESTENCKLRSQRFKHWLKGRARAEFQLTANNYVLEDAISTLEAEAQFDNPEFETAVRVAGDQETLYLHLADEKGTVIRIDPDSVDALDASDACKYKLVKKAGMLALPLPKAPASLDEARKILLEELRMFCNVSDDSDYLLFLTALLAGFCPTGPYPIVLVVGEQGSAKSSLCKVFRKLIDPSKAMLRTFPRKEQDLWITASNSWIIAFDNVSKVPQDVSDALCRLATGGGNTYRTLYENDQETFFQAQRLILLNTIVLRA